MRSLLYYDDTPPRSISEDTAKELMLDRIVARITSNPASRKIFLKIICAPFTEVSSIRYRQDILRDLLCNQSALPQLCDLFARYGELHEEYAETKKKSDKLSASDEIYTAVFHANTVAFTLKKILVLTKEINDTMRSCAFSSDAMTGLLQRTGEIVNAEAYEKLLAIASVFENYSAFDTTDSIAASVSTLGRINDIDFLSIMKSPENGSDGRRLFQPFRRKKETKESSVILQNDYLIKQIFISVIKNATEAMKFAVKSIIEEFGNIREELIFYSVALKYSEILEKATGALTFPTFGEDVDVSSLYDVYLMLSEPNQSTVVPNDFRMHNNTKGILIEGDNNSGKTVYLRSFVVASVFAQSGLPIAAEKAKLSLYNQVYVLMASAEKQPEANNNFGAFEDEVSKVETFVNSAAQGSLVIFNEVFQTTDYTEGAEGLYHILNYFSDNKIKWVIVTHFGHLSDLYADDGDVAKLHMSENNHYKIMNL